MSEAQICRSIIQFNIVCYLKLDAQKKEFRDLSQSHSGLLALIYSENLKLFILSIVLNYDSGSLGLQIVHLFLSQILLS